MNSKVKHEVKKFLLQSSLFITMDLAAQSSLDLETVNKSFYDIASEKDKNDNESTSYEMVIKKLDDLEQYLVISKKMHALHLRSNEEVPDENCVLLSSEQLEILCKYPNKFEE